MCFPFFLSHWLEVGHGPAPSASPHWPNIGQCPAFFQTERQLHKLEPLTRLQGFWQILSLHWLNVPRARDVIGPREARGWGARPKRREGAQRRGTRSGVGCFGLDCFFFRERSLLWPRLKAAASSCPLLRPWAHTSGCRLQSESAKFSRAKGSPIWYSRNARLCLLGTLSCKETAVWSPLAQTSGSSQDTQNCTFLQRGLAGPRRS